MKCFRGGYSIQNKTTDPESKYELIREHHSLVQPRAFRLVAVAATHVSQEAG